MNRSARSTHKLPIISGSKELTGLQILVRSGQVMMFPRRFPFQEWCHTLLAWQRLQMRKTTLQGIRTNERRGGQLELSKLGIIRDAAARSRPAGLHAHVHEVSSTTTVSSAPSSSRSYGLQDQRGSSVGHDTIGAAILHPVHACGSVVFVTLTSSQREVSLNSPLCLVG